MSNKRQKKKRAKDMRQDGPDDSRPQPTLFDVKEEPEPQKSAVPGGNGPEEDAEEDPADRREPETRETDAPAGTEREESELESLRREREEYLDLAQRSRAELENFRRRVAREREVERVRIQGDVLRNVLTPLDDLDRALAAANEAQDFDTLFQGLKMVRDGLWKGLGDTGLQRIAADPGTGFDPNVHEGMARVPHPDFPQNAIVEEIASGYRLGELVLRASKVVVSSGPPEAAEEEENGG